MSAVNESAANPYRPKSIRGWFVSALVGGLFCIGFPAAFTAMVPVTYLQMTRQGDQVAAHSQTCLLLVIPFYTQSLDNVLEVTSEFQAGGMMEVDQKVTGTTDRMIRAEDSGWLILANHDKRMKISVSPANLETYQRDVRDFLDASLNAAPAKAELRKFCVANWKASILAGVPLCLLTVLYLVCLGSPLIEWPIRAIFRLKR